MAYKFEIAQLKHIFEKLGEFPYMKLVASYVFVFLSWVMDGSYEIMVTVFVLLVVDTITGAGLALRNLFLHKKGLYKGPPENIFSSRGIYRGPFKLFIYAMFILVSRLVDKHIPFPFFAPAIDAFLVTTEAYSIFENFAKMGVQAPTTIFEKLKSFASTKKSE